MGTPPEVQSFAVTQSSYQDQRLSTSQSTEEDQSFDVNQSPLGYLNLTEELEENLPRVEEDNQQDSVLSPTSYAVCADSCYEGNYKSERMQPQSSQFYPVRSRSERERSIRKILDFFWASY